MIDDEMDDQMRQLAQSYNSPPETPREAMWERIESARSSTVVPIGVTRRTRWLRTAAGIAAVLLVGIGIGRMTRGGPSSAVPVVASTKPTAGTPDSSAAPSIATAENATDASSDSVVAASPESSDAAQNSVRTGREQRIRSLRDSRGAPSRDLAAYGVPRRVPGVVGEGSDMNAYRLAVVDHMARTEVLLTSFRAESRSEGGSERAASQFASLSRELLKTTRLLLATRPNDDPALTRLLEDLELVLMQISQYTSEGRRGDLDAINQSLDRRNVLPKLRSTIPAGASATAGT
jgi:hypothetical protein